MSKMSSSVRVLLLLLLATASASERDTMPFQTGHEYSRSQLDFRQDAMASSWSASSPMITTASEVADKSQVMSEDRGEDVDKALSLAKRSLQEGPSKQQQLAEITMEFFQLVMNVDSYSFDMTFSKFSPIFERLANLTPSQEPVDLQGPESQAESMIIAYVQQIVKHLYDNLPNPFPGKLIANTFPSGGALLFKVSPTSYDKVFGYPIYSKGEFSLATTHYSDRFTIYAVYPANSSPFSPLPFSEFPITKSQSVDMVVIPDYTTSIDISAKQSIVLRWTPTSYTPNLKHKCANWDSITSAYVYDKCVVIQSTGTPGNVTCFCELDYSASGLEAGFVLFAYEEDQATTTCVNQSLLKPYPMSGTADVTELQRNLQRNRETTESQRDILVSHFNDSRYYCGYLSQLSVTMRLVQAASDDKVLEDIGTILDKVQPEEGRNTIAIRNDDLASFVINLKTNKGEPFKGYPPIGFGIYKNLTYGMEYFRTEEDNNIDYSIIFSNSMSYGLLFSKSVVEQNSRFVFLLYPPDKFFKPAAVIDGHRVASMRVLDVVLTSNKQDHQDQFVHLFSGKVTTDRLVGCASWSASLGDWSSADCHPDPDLHDGVCTCNMTVNFVESSTRGQYVVYTYATSFYAPEIPVEPNEAEVQLRAELAIYRIHKFPTSYVGTKSPTYVLDLLSDAIKCSARNINKACEITDDILTILRDFVFGGEQVVKSSDFKLITGLTSSEKQTAFFCGATKEECRLYLINKEFLAGGSKISYALRVAPMSADEFFQYACILFPPRVAFQAAPRVAGHKVATFRVIVINVLVSPVKHLVMNVQFYLDHPVTFSIGCAFWSNALQRWTSDNCNVVNISSVSACSCKLTDPGTDFFFGGQFIVYSYSTASFDESVYGTIGVDSFVDAHAILEQGAKLIENATQLLSCDDADLSTKVLRTYHKILLNAGIVPNGQEKLEEIIDNLMRAFAQFYVDPFVPVFFIYDIPTSWSVKNSEVASDLYSNAVLSSGAVGSVSTEWSDFALAVMGHLHDTEDTALHGIQFPRSNGNAGTQLNTNSSSLLAKENPLFACFVSCSKLFTENRFIFTVYPLNLSPYPYEMTNNSMFNSRQVDIYVNGIGGFTREMSQDSSKCDMIVQVYFQPTEKPKYYIKVGCAIWNKTAKGWSEDVCTVDLIVVDKLVSCSCNLTERGVTSVIMYEYTELINFSLVTLFEGPSVVFIVSASFSLFGFVMIAATAILFPSWREELSNKVLINLVSSSFLYLCMTMFRETHLIFADMKRLDSSLVAFTVCVHYTRLVHHCWGLVMSVLQYQKFSTLAGASATSHLLLKVSLLAWGVPLGPLVVLLSWDVRAHFCSPDKLTHYMLYLVPVIVINFLNLGLMFAIIYNMTNGCGRWDDDDLKKHGGSSKDVLKRQLKQMFMMFFLFGIPTVFEVFNNIVSHSMLLDYIDKILNPIQGFVMFLFFVVMNDKTRGLWIGGVFGDTPVVVNPPPAKKVVFKPKVRKTVKTMSNRHDVVDVNAEPKRSPSAEPEIQIITSGGSDISVKYVVQRSDTNQRGEDSCAAGEGGNVGSKESEGRDNLAPSDIAVLDLKDGSRLVVGGIQQCQLRCESDLSKMLAVLKRPSFLSEYGDDQEDKSRATARELVSQLRIAAESLELKLNGTFPDVSK